MRALTLTQPWAGLVASGIKLVENRPRPIAPRDLFGKRFAIHASRQIDESVYARIGRTAPDLPWTSGGEPAPWWRFSRITSAVIAVATLVGFEAPRTPDFTSARNMEHAVFIEGDQRRWFFGPIGYVLRDVQPLAMPVPCKGALGFWTLPAEVEREVTAQLTRAA